MNAWDKQTGVKGRVIKAHHQSDASIKRILDSVPRQTLRADSSAYNDWSSTVSAYAIRSRSTAKCGTVTVRRKTRKPRQ